jgi:hypothetical protein
MWRAMISAMSKLSIITPYTVKKAITGCTNGALILLGKSLRTDRVAR